MMLTQCHCVSGIELNGSTWIFRSDRKVCSFIIEKNHIERIILKLIIVALGKTKEDCQKWFLFRRKEESTLAVSVRRAKIHPQKQLDDPWYLLYKLWIANKLITSIIYRYWGSLSTGNAQWSLVVSQYEALQVSNWLVAGWPSSRLYPSDCIVSAWYPGHSISVDTASINPIRIRRTAIEFRFKPQIWSLISWTVNSLFECSWTKKIHFFAHPARWG